VTRSGVRRGKQEIRVDGDAAGARIGFQQEHAPLSVFAVKLKESKPIKADFEGLLSRTRFLISHLFKYNNS
jgi:hypothetical protein